MVLHCWYTAVLLMGLSEGLFNLSYGAILIPYFGVEQAFGDDVAQFNNAVGFFMLSKWSEICKEEVMCSQNGLVWAILALFLSVSCVSAYVYTQ